jgi:hypothetical protein
VRGISQSSAQFLEGGQVACDDPETLAAAVWQLEDIRDRRIGEHSFRESVEAARAAERAKAQMIECMKRRNQRAVQQVLQERQQYSQEEFQAFQREMKEREDELEMSIQEQVGQMRERHRRELVEHDQSWKGDPKQRQYNRASQQLRILRVQEQLLLNSSRFDEAEQVCGIADRLEALQTHESHFQMATSFAASRTLLFKKQAHEMDTLLKACEVRRGKFKYVKEVRTRRFTNRFLALQFEEDVASDPEKLWVRGHRYDGDPVVKLCGKTRPGSAATVRAVDVARFNTLKLPPLPVPQSPGAPKPLGFDFRKTL